MTAKPSAAQRPGLLREFLDPLRVEERSDGRTWRLLEELRYRTRRGAVLTVPAGFITDFASIPRIFWSLVPPLGRYNRGAVLHDWLYRQAARGGEPDLDRAAADRLLREAMAESGVPWLTRWVIYLGVRLGGWAVWRARRAVGPAAARRFALLRHEGRDPVHFDFLLDEGAALATWRFVASPIDLGPGRALRGVRRPDHRRLYLDYEGPLSGGRGTVAQVNAGTAVEQASSPECLELTLRGQRWRGRCRLERAAAGTEWIWTRLP